MMVAVAMMGRVAHDSDVAALAVPTEDGAFSMDVPLNDGHVAMLGPAMERGKNETHRQEYE